MKCVITGGAGFIGSTLCDELIRQGNQVVVIDNLSNGLRCNVNPEATFVQQDITALDAAALSHIRHADVLFHMAARARVQPSLRDPAPYMHDNVHGTSCMLEHARAMNIGRVVLSSSSSVYGDTDVVPTPECTPCRPRSPYATTKLMQELLCESYTRCYGMSTVCLRYFNVYGERQPLHGAYKLVMSTFLTQKRAGLPMTIRGDGTQRRDFTYVGDVVEANITAAMSPEVGNAERINIGASDNMSVMELAELIEGEYEFVDAVDEPKETLADRTLASELLNWKPTTNVTEWLPEYIKHHEWRWHVPELTGQ